MRLTLNADDLGFSPGVNRAILELHREGILSRASLVTNLPHSRDALDLLLANPDLGVGVHLNLTKGAPCLPSERVPSLVNGSGRFHSTPLFLARALGNLIDLQEAEAELRAQIERAMHVLTGLTHLDSHAHWHILPQLRWLLPEMAEGYGIPQMRPASPRRALLPNSLWLSTVSSQPAAAKPVRQPDYLLSLHHWVRGTGEVRPALYGEGMRKLLSRPGVTLEMVTHPGYADDPDFPQDTLGPERREWELDFLRSSSFADWLEAMDARLV